LEKLSINISVIQNNNPRRWVR